MTNERGFTMIEAIIVIVIIGIIASMGFSFVASSANTYVLAKAEGRVASEAYAALNRITRELQFADISTVTAPAQLAADGTTAPSTTLTFLTVTPNFPTGWSENTVNCPNCQDGSTSITYSLAGGVLTRTSGLGAQTLADGITAFNVTMTRTSRTAAACGGACTLASATTAGSNVVGLNALDTVTPGQAKNLLLTVGAQTVRITNYVVGTNTGTVSPVWTAASALGAAYSLWTEYLTITITKTDAASGASVTLTQTVYPSASYFSPVN